MTPPSPPTPPSRRRPLVAGQRRQARGRVTPPEDAQAATPVEDEATLHEEATGPLDTTGPATGPVDEPAGATPVSAAAARSRWRAEDAWLPAAVLAGAIVVLATIAGLLFATHHAGERRLEVADARTAAKLAGSQGLAAVLSYDYRHFDADVARGGRFLTPSFRKQYVDQQQRAVKATAVHAKAKVSADVAAVGVVDASPSTVTLLAFVDQTSTLAQRPVPKIDRSRVVVTVEKHGGRWLISGISPV